jgi:iron complex outermembrane receptor protein
VSSGAAWAAAAGTALLAGSTAVLAEQPATEPTVQADALQEVVVTAQFRAEKLQESPLAITAISGEALRERGANSLVGLSGAAPNVNLQLTGSAYGKSASAFIRGVGQGDFNFAYEPGVGIYVDDVYHATVFGSVFELLDLERVEVLRGPQGTLFGKNSIGGAVRLISRKPKGDGSGYIEGTWGNLNRQEFRGGFDIGVTDNLFLRVTGMSKKVSGYVDRLDYACAHPDLGAGQGYAVNPSAPRLIHAQTLGSGNCVVGTEGGEDVRGVRAALRWIAGEKTDVTLSADWLEDNSEAAASILLFANPGAAKPPFLAGVMNSKYNLPTYGVAWDQRFITGNPFTTYSTFYDPNSGRTVPAVSTVKSYGTGLTIESDLSSAVHLKSVTAYRGYSGAFADDQDGSPLNLAYAYNVVDHHQFSQEVQFTGTAGRLDWATGAFYFDGYNLNRGHINLDFFLARAPGIDFNQDDPSNVKDYAAFAQGTYHVTDKLGLTLGARYTDEKKDYTYNHISLPFINLVGAKRGTSYTRPDYKVGVDYKWTPDVMTYAQVSTGFKGGGFNPRPFNTNQVIAFGPEKLTSFEVGAKSEWFDRKLRLNTALYFSKYEDFQLNSQTVDELGQPLTAPRNVGRADIKGVEIELTAHPFGGLQVSAALGLIDFKYKDLGAAIGCSFVPPGTPCNATGPSLNDVPPNLSKWTGNLGIQYMFHLAGGASLTPRLDGNFRTRTPGGVQNDLYTDDDVAGYTLFNGRVTWDSADGKWSLAAWGTNITDKQYYVNKFDLRSFGEGMMSGQPGRPREWGLQVRRQF